LTRLTDPAIPITTTQIGFFFVVASSPGVSPDFELEDAVWEGPAVGWDSVDPADFGGAEADMVGLKVLLSSIDC
jgi:hypothetical protein